MSVIIWNEEIDMNEPVTELPFLAEIGGEERYRAQIRRLQDEAGLTFDEARALLTPDQEFSGLVRKYGSPEAVYDIRRRGDEKVRKITGGDKDKYEDLVPMEMYIVF